jgi:hypothetical protein
MADYAAVPVQVIAHGLLLIDGAGNPFLAGSRGFHPVVTRGVAAHGDFIINFDDQEPDPVSIGLPGSNAIDPRRAHISITQRGNGASPPTSRISNRDSGFVMTPGAGATAIEVTTSNLGGGLIDPVGANSNGLEIVVWQYATPDLAQAQLFGPTYQPAMMFP